MNRQEFETLFTQEGSYWWFVGQRFVVNRFLRKLYPDRKDLRLLDVGCGTGLTLEMLQEFGQVQGMDIADEALEFCSKRGFSILKSDLMNIELADNQMDVVTALGVFYHKNVTDDMQGMKEIYRILKPDGRVIILDCAMKCLYGKHDLAFHGARRYSKKELRQKLESAGFRVEKLTYYNTILFPAVYVKRKLDNLMNKEPKSDVQENFPAWLNWLLTKIYKTELRGTLYLNYPFGVNILAVAQKDPDKQVEHPE